MVPTFRPNKTSCRRQTQRLFPTFPLKPCEAFRSKRYFVSTGAGGISKHFISTCWHKTTRRRGLAASQMVTVMRASGCGAGDVASHPAKGTCIGLDSPQQSLLPLQAATYSCFTRRAERMTLQRGGGPLTYSDGVSSPHQSHMAANPLQCSCRKKKKERDGGVKDVMGVFALWRYRTRDESSMGEAIISWQGSLTRRGEMYLQLSGCVKLRR